MSRKNPKPQAGWGYYNYGALRGIRRTRKDAIAAIEENCGEPWHEARKYMEVHKVTVVPAATQPPAGKEETAIGREESGGG